MKIAVDCYEVTKYSTGVGRVIDNFLRNLFCLLPEDTFFILTREKIQGYSENQAIQHIIPWKKGYIRWQNGPFVKRLKKIKPDLLIASNYTLPFFNRWPSILLVYDISVIAHPEWYRKKITFTRKFLLERSLEKSTLVIAPSEFTKGEILKFFKIKAEKVKVVSCGVNDAFSRCSASSIVEWKKKKGLENKKIIGYLGSIFARRNMPLLVGAADLLRKEFPETVLYVIGKDMTHPPQNIGRLLDKDWVKWEMFIPENELSLFYSAIDVFAYPSEYEGFGLPPLEALFCGSIPVVLKRSSFDEIYKDMAIMVDEPEVVTIKEALKRAMTDERAKLEILNRFSQKRLQFSWQKTSSEFSSIIQKLKQELPSLKKTGGAGKGESYPL